MVIPRNKRASVSDKQSAQGYAVWGLKMILNFKMEGVLKGTGVYHRHIKLKCRGGIVIRRKTDHKPEKSRGFTCFKSKQLWLN